MGQCGVGPEPVPPLFLGDHYYCESGNSVVFTFIILMTPCQLSRALWDGSGCAENNNYWANLNQPWFFCEMVTKVQDDIEIRLCTNQVFDDEAVLVEQIQLYVC